MAKVQKRYCNNAYFLNHFDYNLGYLQKLATLPLPTHESFDSSFKPKFPFFQNYLNPFWNLSNKFKHSLSLKTEESTLC